MDVTAALDRMLLRRSADFLKVCIRAGWNPYDVMRHLACCILAMVLVSHAAYLVDAPGLSAHIISKTAFDVLLYGVGMLILYRLGTDAGQEFRTGHVRRSMRQANAFFICSRMRILFLCVAVPGSLIPIMPHETGLSGFMTLSDLASAAAYCLGMYVFTFRTSDVLGFKRRTI